MLIRSKYVPATNYRGSRIQFSLLYDNGITRHRKQFSYDLQPPANAKERIRSLTHDGFDLFEELKDEDRAMVCMFQDFLEYLNKKMELHPRDHWKYTDFTMVLANGGCDRMFVFNFHATKLG